MKDIRWNQLKSERLKKTRGAFFEDIIKSKLIAVLKHPVRNNQQLMLFEHNDYIWVVPFVNEKDHYFLKTLFPSRKYTKLYKGAKK